MPLNRASFCMFFYYIWLKIVTILPVANNTIIPAVITPKTSGITAFLNGTCKKFAINEPTQAPVPGIGIATNRYKPNAVKFWSLLLLPNFNSYKHKFYFQKW